jgi:hypothetical protein
MFGDQIPDRPVQPAAMEGDHIELEGHQSGPHRDGGGGTPKISTILHVPALSAVVARYRPSGLNATAVTATMVEDERPCRKKERP